MNSHIRYLGTNIPCNLRRIFELNYAPILRTLKSDLLRWDKETFTWFGRLSILKLNVMPRLTYLFQTMSCEGGLHFLSWRAKRQD